MNKNTKIIICVIIALVIVVAVFALLHRSALAPKIEAQAEGYFLIYAGDAEYRVTMEDVEALSPFEIEANYKKSGKAAETRTYTGVSLAEIVESLGMDISGFSSVAFTAADGYASALSLAEAMNGENCFIVIAADGEPLGSKADGGGGPFMMILARDQFSQRWCKFLLDVTFQ
ncbi:MAG: molybdopterin-dependent oxidoreductase [Clostridiales bacterium]|nr:molybdopterin-dependent oxidoreductase [Clostridiales bacterium]